MVWFILSKILFGSDKMSFIVVQIQLCKYAVIVVSPSTVVCVESTLGEIGHFHLFP